MTRENQISARDLHMPNIDPKFHERYPNEVSGVTGLFRELGLEMPTTNRQFDHWEGGRLFNAVALTGIVAQPAAGDPITVTVAAADHANSGKTSPVREGDIVMFKNRTIGKVITKNTATDNAHTLTIEPNLNATQFPAVAASGDKLVILTYADKEGSTERTEQVFRQPQKWRGITQIIREDFKVTGSEMCSVSWINVAEGSDLAKQLGKSGPFWYMQEQLAAYSEFLKNVEMALLHNEATDNAAILTDVGAGVGDLDLTYTTTTGLIPSIQSHGINQTYTSGTWGIAQFQALTNLLDAEDAAPEYLAFLGNKVTQLWDTSITDVFKQGAITYGAFGGEYGEERAVRYGFDSFRLDGYTFHYKKYAPFHHPGLLGVASGGPNYQEDFFGIPMDTRRDVRTRAELPSIRIRYRADGGADAHAFKDVGAASQNRMSMEAITGGFPLPSGIRTDNTDTATFSYLSECGLEVVGLNRFFYYTTA